MPRQYYLRTNRVLRTHYEFTAHANSRASTTFVLAAYYERTTAAGTGTCGWHWAPSRAHLEAPNSRQHLNPDSKRSHNADKTQPKRKPGFQVQATPSRAPQSKESPYPFAFHRVFSFMKGSLHKSSQVHSSGGVPPPPIQEKCQKKISGVPAYGCPTCPHPRVLVRGPPGLRRVSSPVRLRVLRKQIKALCLLHGPHDLLPPGLPLYQHPWSFRGLKVKRSSISPCPKARVL